MSYIDVWSAVDANLEDDTKMSCRYIHYVFPRKIGTTSYLIDLANRKAAEGKSVIFFVQHIAHIPDYKIKLDPSVEVTVFDGDNMKDREVDWLIGDNIGPEIKKVNAVLNSVWALTGGNFLHIDSVE